VLEYRNTKLAVVEAKAEEEELTEGVPRSTVFSPFRRSCLRDRSNLFVLRVSFPLPGV